MLSELLTACLLKQLLGRCRTSANLNYCIDETDCIGSKGARRILTIDCSADFRVLAADGSDENLAISTVGAYE